MKKHLSSPDLLAPTSPLRQIRVYRNTQRALNIRGWTITTIFKVLTTEQRPSLSGLPAIMSLHNQLTDDCFARQLMNDRV